MIDDRSGRLSAGQPGPAGRARIARLAVLAALALPGMAKAASCEPTLFPQALAPLEFARVTSAKLPVFHDPEACSRPTGLCPSKAYLVAGDTVISAQTVAGKTCVAFIGARRPTIGWVDAGMLAPLPATPPVVDWAGKWERVLGDAEATIERRGGRVLATLSASAVGANPDNVRTGGADGALAIRGDLAQMSSQGDPDCKVTLRRLGRFLIVNDGASDDANSACGGIGVTMNGVYTRVGP
jgi:hypothetical protein